MVFIRVSTFCFCLPVRFGIFVLAILGVLVGGSLAVTGWIELSRIVYHHVSLLGEIALYVQTVIFTLLALVSMIGFIGVAVGSRRILFIYGIVLAIHLLFSIGSGILSIYTFFREDALDWDGRCANVAGDSTESCGKRITAVKGIIIAFFVISYFVQFYGCIIVANFVDHMDEEKAAELPIMNQNSAPLPVTTYNSYGAGSYAFTVPPNSQAAQGHSLV